MSGALIRPMVPADVPAVRALEASLFDDPWSPQALERFLGQRALALVVESGGGPCAYLLCSHGGGEADLLRIGVTPEQRRRGWAAALLRRLQAALVGEGVTSLFLEVRASNGGAIACYRAQGFSPMGRRRNYYCGPDGAEDALLMRWTPTADAS